MLFRSAKLVSFKTGQWPDTRADIDQQLKHLFQIGFMRDTPSQWLGCYPRYLKALDNRVSRLSGQYGKDQTHVVMLVELTAPLYTIVEQRPGLYLESAAAMQYRWMLEELRVSLFAQSLGTQMAVSQKRLAEQWQVVLEWIRQNPH